MHKTGYGAQYSWVNPIMMFRKKYKFLTTNWLLYQKGLTKSEPAQVDWTPWINNIENILLLDTTQLHNPQFEKKDCMVDADNS